MDVRQIIDKIDDFQLFVPAFQREYVWKRPDVKALFASPHQPVSDGDACSASAAASTTDRYVHLDDATVSQAQERVAVAIQRRLVVGYDTITATTD